jgi:hypothetical protein
MSGNKDSDDDQSPRLKVTESYRMLWSNVQHCCIVSDGHEAVGMFTIRGP